MLKTILALATVLSACTDAAPASTVESFTASSPAGRTSPTVGTLREPPQPATVTVIADQERGATLIGQGSEAAIDLADSPCACTTTACMSQWIEDNIGCDVVVDLVCPDGMRGGLVRCTEQDPHLGL